MDEVYDVIVIGAGIYGIQAARTYLEIHPDAKLVILEADEVVGGVWSTKRVYSSFITQTPASMAQFSDLPLELPPEEKTRNSPFCHAKYIARYLEKYVDVHTYNSATIRDRIRFHTRVLNVCRSESTTDGNGRSWEVTCRRESSSQDASSDLKVQDETTLRAHILLDCSGLTSQPFIPSMPGEDQFKGLKIHQKDFGRFEQAILSPKESISDRDTVAEKSPKSIKHIVVLGGAKSAADAVYACAKNGKADEIAVSWVIREDGSGPAALLTNKDAEGFYTRLVASFVPCIFGANTLGQRLLHRTWLGRVVVRTLWKNVDNMYRKSANFGRDDGRDNGFAELESETPVFWQNESSGLNQRDDYWDVVAKNVKIYRRDIASIEPDSIVLRAKEGHSEANLTIPADVLICCTGWSEASPLYDVATAKDWGIPTSLDNEDPAWKELDTHAEVDVLKRFPELEHPPQYRKKSSAKTPFRLYKAMASISEDADRTLLFFGRLMVGNNFLIAEAQALWAVAFLDGHIKISGSEMKQDIAKVVTWSRRRYLNKGQLGHWFFFDVLSYADMLLAQLGLKSHRSKLWNKNMFGPVRAENVRGLLKEYQERYPAPE